MNNKILARLVAAVMAIAMLGTVSFAASLTYDTLNTTGADYTEAYDNDSVKTLIAFVADDAEAEPDATNIIAIDQVEEGYPSVKIDTAKLNKENVIIRFGGLQGQYSDTVISLATGNDVTAETTVIGKDATYGHDVEFTDVAYFADTITVPAGQNATSYGMKIKNDKVNGKWNYFATDAVELGEGEYTYSVLIFAVPAEIQDGWVAESFYSAE